ncbi:hypothetical protein HPB47_024102 [Ixodes persulcatus]|uniref:Uncharacterized protein n=1 Tax=Ixodes persulcatus TaxID=34615 RepID=A0AC60Q7E8_IXOPE|nr:hypothetical protein HPB47_024102 [Ixodes persulcatus]
MYPEKRDAWVAAVRRVHPDGSRWEPSGDCQICSAHFITGRPSNFKDRPDFVPTVFNYARAPGEAAIKSRDLFVERQEASGLGYCATEVHSWARGGASASAAAMTSLLWNVQTGEALVVVVEPAAAAAPARQLCAV